MINLLSNVFTALVLLVGIGLATAVLLALVAVGWLILQEIVG